MSQNTDGDGTVLREREAFSKLLVHTKEYHRLNWRQFAAELSSRPQLFKVDAEDLKSVAYRKINAWGLLIKIVSEYVSRKRTPVPDDLRTALTEMLRQHRIVRNDAKDTSAPAFIKALGLNANICENSTYSHCGPYLHLALDDDARMVTSRCVLSMTLGEDGTPIYRSRRRVPSSGYRRYVGAYFATDSNLYLIGTPLRSVDIRLSLFSIVSGERQNILRGVVLGVSQRGSVLTSRCLLVKADFLRSTLRKTIFAAPLLKEQLPEEITELGNYLFGLEKPDYIKVSTGE